ncbi:hypothetical protein COO60DRAFT_724069 [Scenedesmus sp. NREL 46B-D3]|nr:hypothetical protein COO60DRAFT_724069 [Scenedesmus sp. NREL 46B-D3]
MMDIALLHARAARAAGIGARHATQAGGMALLLWSRSPQSHMGWEPICLVIGKCKLAAVCRAWAVLAPQMRLLLQHQPVHGSQSLLTTYTLKGTGHCIHALQACAAAMLFVFSLIFHVEGAVTVGAGCAILQCKTRQDSARLAKSVESLRQNEQPTIVSRFVLKSAG